MTRLAIVVLFAGLMGPALAEEPGAQPPAQKAAAQAASPDKVIAQILAVSGKKKTLDRMPEYFLAGFHKGLTEAAKRDRDGKIPPDLLQAMDNSAKDAFKTSSFTGHVTRAMKKDYEDHAYREYLADFSTPLARRMGELESRGQPSEQEIADFKAKLAANPLSPERLEMLHRLDAESRTSEMLSTVILTISQNTVGGIASASGNCVTEQQIKQAQMVMQASLNQNRSNLEIIAQTMLAFTYRDVSDEDLAKYLAIYEKDNSRRIHDIIYNATVEELNQTSARLGRGILKAVRQKKAAMGVTSCEGSVDNVAANEPQVPDATNEPDTPAQPAAPAVASEPAPASGEQGPAPTPKSSIPLEKRRGGDVTSCLEAGNKSDKDIAACAEKYRHAK